MALEGAAALIAAVVFVVRAFAGADQHVVSGFGNAAWFAVIGAVRPGGRLGPVDRTALGAGASRCSPSCCCCR